MQRNKDGANILHTDVYENIYELGSAPILKLNKLIRVWIYIYSKMSYSIVVKVIYSFSASSTKNHKHDLDVLGGKLYSDNINTHINPYDQQTACSWVLSCLVKQTLNNHIFSFFMYRHHRPFTYKTKHTE